MTFKDTKGTDYVVGGLWAKRGADSYLVFVIRARLDFPATLDAVRRMTHLFPRSRTKLVEAAANGHAVISTLKHEIPGIVAVKVGGDSKTARAEAGSPFVRAGNFWIPTKGVANQTPELGWDPEAFIDECTAFDKGTHDDQVDMWSQYANEKYVKHGAGRVHSPVGAGPSTKIPEAPQSEMARRLAARRG